MTDIYIGVEGGGTHTRLLIEQQGDRVMHDIRRSIRFIDQGYESAAGVFAELLAAILGSDIEHVRSIAMGLAGAGLETEQRSFEEAILRLLPSPRLTVHVQSDSTLTLGTAFGQEAGIVLIAGTGSVAIGQDQSGMIHRVGGWGRTLGDEGSGHAIGLEALKHFTRTIDGRASRSQLSERVRQRIEVNVEHDTREMRTWIARQELQPSQFAEAVFETSADPVSEDILDRAADDLLELWHACSHACKGVKETRGAGSVLRNPLMFDRVSRRISAEGGTISMLQEDAPLRYALSLSKQLSQVVEE